MADLAIGISKTVVEALMNKVETAIKEEAELWQIVQRDAVFMRDEFEMMRSFLRTADWERIKNNVVRTWVRQVRDLSYDAEDCVESILLLDTKRSCWTFWLRLVASCGCYSGAPSPLDLAVTEIKLLKARVEEVSNRNMRYSLSNDSVGSKLIKPQQLESVSAVGAIAFDIFKEAWCSAKGLVNAEDLNLTSLLTKKNAALQVISVWGTGGDISSSCIIKRAYENCNQFTGRAWLKLSHPFNPIEFIRSLVHQFHGNSLKEPLCGVDVLTEMVVAQGTDLVKECAWLLREHRYLVVLEGLSNIAEWQAVRIFLPDCKNGSRIVVSTQQLEIAKLCTDPYQVLPLLDLPDGHSIYGFCGKDYFKLVKNSVVSGGSSLPNNVHLLGRSRDEDKLSKLISSAAQSDREYVVSVWGFAGVGKSALVRTVLQRQAKQTSRLFQWYGWVDVSGSFNLAELCRKLLNTPQSSEGDHMLIPKKGQELKTDEQVIKEYAIFLQNRPCLFVINDLKLTEDWDKINKLNLESSKSCIVVTTRDKSVATYCAGKDDAVHEVEALGSKAGFNLFKQKFEETKASWDAHMVKEAENLIAKCGGIPEVIVAVAKYLGTQQEDIRQRRLKGLKADFMHELETNAEFVSLRDLFQFMHSTFDALPQSLKACILYQSVFPEAYRIRRNRFVLRWIAEGYSNCTDSKTAEDYAGDLFDSHETWTTTTMANWKLNNFFHEYINSRLMKESVVFFPLVVSLLSEENRSITTERLGQHLSIRSNWKRDESVFDNLDFSQLQSMTVFGEWREFFIPCKMRSLRVLDLEGTEGVTDEELQRILVLLPRLRFLSLRGHSEITCLPNSLYDLRLLQTLDIRDTSITRLPSRIIKLQKLQYIRAGTDIPWMANDKDPSTPKRFSPVRLPKFFIADSCRGAIDVPRQIGKLTALHTLGAVKVNTASGAAIVMGLKKLITRLRKLELYGISRKQSQKLISVFNGGTHLEELTLCLEQGNGVIPWENIRCMSNLWSLKLIGGHVKQLPPEIMYLHNLMKLSFQMITLTEADIQCLGRLTKLHTLRLRAETVQGYQLHFYVHPDDADCEGCRLIHFRELKTLEIACSSRLHIKFGEGALGELEQLKLYCCNEASLQVTGLEHPISVKKVWLKGSSDETFNEAVQQQLTRHPKKPTLMLN